MLDRPRPARARAHHPRRCQSRSRPGQKPARRPARSWPSWRSRSAHRGRRSRAGRRPVQTAWPLWNRQRAACRVAPPGCSRPRLLFAMPRRGKPQKDGRAGRASRQGSHVAASWRGGCFDSSWCLQDGCCSVGGGYNSWGDGLSGWQKQRAFLAAARQSHEQQGAESKSRKTMLAGRQRTAA